MRLFIALLLLCSLANAAIVKNSASRIAFAAVNSSGDFATGDAANITAYRAIDGATTGTALTDTSAAEVGTTGVYWFDLTAGETNGDVIVYYATSTTSGVTLDRVIVTTIVPASYMADVSALATSAALATVDGNVDLILADTGTDGVVVAAGSKTGYSLATAPPTASTIASQVRTELGTELGRIDAAISSRSTYAGGAVASVTGNVGGNVAGSVGSVTAGVTVTTNNDKTGYSLATAPPTAQNIWQYGTRTLTSAGSSGATAQEVWEYATRSLTDKTGFSLATAPPTASQVASEVWGYTGAIGLTGLLDVNLVSWLDATPDALVSGKVAAEASVAFTESDIADIASAVAAAVGSTGDGSVAVDWDYGGMTAYATAGGVPIDNATVRAYLTSDYTAYRRGSGYIKAQTTTNVLGRFTDPMHLDPGAYTLVWVKQGIAGPDTVTLTVE